MAAWTSRSTSGSSTVPSEGFRIEVATFDAAEVLAADGGDAVD
jgi:hypothetical protein